ncbi:hypothetical protein H8699_10170 [Christensenellaceae bacterium NSJ-44]|uniref:Uncharacterized protein n=1 Tax=Luoshenia tenuis TaxID=2763654 RepID=A0A926D121_9FIRM|nr:hypothetical protein [Luoshenia tenuis]MBC8529793.1 hypothetical protein [Luoshenia tenuis]
MGEFYRYKCDQCGFEKEFRLGIGFLSGEKYFAKSQEASNQLKNEALAGQHGQLIKTIVRSSSPDELFYCCDEHLYQCAQCKNLLKWHSKKILGNWSVKNGFAFLFEAHQSCPDCASHHFKPIRTTSPICPACKEAIVDLICLGFWD